MATCHSHSPSPEPGLFEADGKRLPRRHGRCEGRLAPGPVYGKSPWFKLTGAGAGVGSHLRRKAVLTC